MCITYEYSISCNAKDYGCFLPCLSAQHRISLASHTHLLQPYLHFIASSQVPWRAYIYIYIYICYTNDSFTPSDVLGSNPLSLFFTTEVILQVIHCSFLQALKRSSAHVLHLIVIKWSYTFNRSTSMEAKAVILQQLNTLKRVKIPNGTPVHWID